jgi:hopanoid biosynthesis associated protein HpnK
LTIAEVRRDKRLIINGDDLGLSVEVNRAIVHSHRDGVLTAASLMITGNARDQAVAAAGQFPGLDVGLHLVFCDGASLLPAARLRGVVSAGKRFAGHEVPAGFRYLLNPRLRGALRDECRAQIELHLKLVGYLNHVDGHRNLHLHPVLVGILAELAPEYHISYVRAVREPLLTTLTLARDRLGFKLIDAAFFSLLSAFAVRKLKAYGIRFTDHVFGFLQTGRLSTDYVRGVIERLKPGSITEFYFHPTANPDPTRQARPAAETEVAILTNPSVRAAIAESGVILTNFAELTRPRPSSPDGRF